MESVESYVQRYSLADLLSPDLLVALRPLAHEEGELIIRAASPMTDLLFFVEGRAKVYGIMENGSSLLTGYYKPFDVLGDAELFSYERYTLNVEADTATVCLGLGVAAIKKAAERNCRLFMYLCGRLGRKLVGFNSSASINLTYPVENRLASYLLAAVDVPDLGELAALLGTSYRQLSRVVRRFKEEGILKAGRGPLRVLSREKLEPLARDLYL